MEKNDVMQISYDADTDILYLSIGEPRPAISREIGDDVLLRLDPNPIGKIGLDQMLDRMGITCYIICKGLHFLSCKGSENK